MTPRTEAWEREIRAFLLGRLALKTSVGALLHPKTEQFASPPIRRWWLFEGKLHRLLGGSLATQARLAFTMARRLRDTFNPRLRVTDRLEGGIDWPATLSRGYSPARPEYVLRAGAAGLSEAEHAALAGWVSWIGAEWIEYTAALHGPPVPFFWPEQDAAPASLEQLRRWAHAARRSRWPFLREVVAESIRPALEPEELDRIPLPADPSTLFELLCLVRLAGFLSPSPKEIRWLGWSGEGNDLAFDSFVCQYQQYIERDRVLQSSAYTPLLASAMRHFDVSVHQRVDLAIDFDEPRAGIAGVIIEAKSGAQGFADTVPQLCVYQAARPRAPGSRYVIWGLVEEPQNTPTTAEQVRRALESAGSGDVWVFSTADEIPTVLEAILYSATPAVRVLPSPARQQAQQIGRWA